MEKGILRKLDRKAFIVYRLPQLSHYLRGYSQNGPRQRPGSLQSITNVFMPGSGFELTVASGLLLWIGMLVFGYSAWWLTLSAATFYVWYVLEWCIRKMIASILADCREDYDAYRLILSEREARLAEKDNNYLENSSYFQRLVEICL